MLLIRQTRVFARWVEALRDRNAQARIDARIGRLVLGNRGDVRPVGGGVSEPRINYGPGYRVYYMQRGDVLIVLLCGGDKSEQSHDLTRAKQLALEWETKDAP